MTTFTQLGLSKTWGKALYNQGIQQPTPVQEATIPPFLDGENLFVQAQTGSGKTFAFLLPMLQTIDRSSTAVQGLILTPTRELALQISEELKKITENVPEIRSFAVYGGQDVEAQVKKSKRGAQLIVATPGRLIDHLERGTISLDTVRMFVLDEGDEMLRMGFLPEVRHILSFMNNDIQACIFSATLHDEVRSVATFFMKNAREIRIAPEQRTVKEIEQIMVETTDRRKYDELIDYVRNEQPFLAVIFCRTIRRAAKLCDKLKSEHFLVDELHGELSQAKREKVMRDFREARIQLLVATDVASRGLDVEGVTHVFNFDIPRDVDSYVHRIGRTGRAGEKGKAITFYTTADLGYLHDIQDFMQNK
ncbi:MAG: DEAD/DEAH box helicase [Bacilli bacterium]